MIMNRIQALHHNPYILLALLGILIPLIAYIMALRNLSLRIRLFRVYSEL